MKQKNNTLQIMRAVAIIMVVLQHSIGRIASTNIELKTLFLLNHIDVSIFFMISGYLYECKKHKYRSEGFYKFLRQKFNALMVPYLFWSLLIPVGMKLVNIVLGGRLDSNIWTWQEIVINTITYKDFYVQHLWFIYILFVFFLIHYLTGDLLIKLPVLVLLFCILNIINEYDLPFLVGKFVLHFTTFCIGRLVAQCRLIRFNKKKCVYVAALIILLCCFFSELVIPNSFTYKLYGHLIYALSGCIMVYFIASKITIHGGKMCDCLLFLGLNSFEIYILHNPYVSVTVSLILLRVGLGSNLTVCLTTVFSIIVPLVAVWFIQKYIPAGIKLFGRKG